MRASVSEVLAVRGERLYACRVRIEGGDNEIEQIVVEQMDEAVQKTELRALFDADDVDAAIAELDRLHQQLAGGEPSELGGPATARGGRSHLDVAVEGKAGVSATVGPRSSLLARPITDAAPASGGRESDASVHNGTAGVDRVWSS